MGKRIRDYQLDFDKEKEYRPKKKKVKKFKDPENKKYGKNEI